jgi:hypothetical protein
MSFIDPTYLRYVYDGLQTGVIQKENNSSLPLGLVGVYEEIFSKSITLIERKRLVDFFTVWAVLKKEVSASLVAELLSWREEDVFNNLNKFSKWFNSFSPNKYVLYHQSFYVFMHEYSSYRKIEKIIITLNSLKSFEAIDYCEKYLNDHNYSLAFTDDKYSKR